MRPIVRSAALVLLLLVSQQYAFAHLVSHASQHSSQHNPAHESSKVCGKCLAAAHLGDSAGAAQMSLHLRRAPAPPIAVADIAHRTHLVHAYRSRAPPAAV
jgi:hypothetical protein